jgi:hypothetical protein
VTITWWYLAETLGWTLVWVLVGTVAGWAMEEQEGGRLW